MGYMRVYIALVCHLLPCGNQLSFIVRLLFWPYIGQVVRHLLDLTLESETRVSSTNIASRFGTTIANLDCVLSRLRLDVRFSGFNDLYRCELLTVVGLSCSTTTYVWHTDVFFKTNGMLAILCSRIFAITPLPDRSSEKDTYGRRIVAR